MKKLTAFLVIGLLALPVFAQQPQKQETPSPSPLLHSTVFTAQDGLLSINLMDHVFFGYNIVDSDAFTPNGGGELSLNTLALNVSPAPSFGLQVGMDCKWQFFSTEDSRFFLDKTKIPQVTPYPIPLPENTTPDQGQTPAQTQAQEQTPTALPEESMTCKYRGSLHTFSLSIPVLATLHLNDNFWFSAGAEANLNMTSWTNFKAESGDVTETTSVADGQVRPFTFNFMGMIGFRDTALFFKYYPKTSRIVPDGGVVFDYCSVGVTLFL